MSTSSLGDVIFLGLAGKQDQPEPGRRLWPQWHVVMSSASLLESVLSSRRDTTAPELVSAVLDRLGQRCEMLLHMLQTISFGVLENAAILMHVLQTFATGGACLKEVALSEGLALKHFYNAVYSPSSTQRYISRACTLGSGTSGRGMQVGAADTHSAERPCGIPQSTSFLGAQKRYLEELEEEYYDNSATQNRKLSPIGFQAGAGAKNLSRSAELQLRMRRRISGC